MRNNGYVHELSARNLAVIFNPVGPATVAIVNYAPVQLLVHTLAWEAFGAETVGHRAVNVTLHALATVLLVALLLATGIPRTAALLGGVFFLLHPANVEAVVWISQLKTTLAMVFTLAALLAHPRRPGLALALFAVALLAKATAAVALPVVALLEWSREGRVRWRWLGLWAVLLAGYAVAEFATHQRSGAAEATLYETPWVLLRTMGALWMRYLVMAATSWGVSAFHEPEPASSWLDPWWLGSLVVTALLLWRMWGLARRRDTELAYWVWAIVSFGPVSQLFPFLYPMADRYLYFILPGLLGGSLLAGRAALARLSAERADPRAWLERGAVALGLAAAAIFALHSSGRAEIWRSGPALVADAARHYPDGTAANLLRSQAAARVGDVETAVAALRRARDRGYDRFEQLEADPVYEPIRNQPEFRAVVREMAASWIEQANRKSNPTQFELRMIAHAHIARGELDQAMQLLERAAEAGGPLTGDIRAELAGIRRALEAGQPELIRLAPVRGGLP